MEEPGGLQSMGSLRVGHHWVTSLSLFAFTHWRRKWQPTPVFLPWESQGQGNLVGLLSMGLHRVRHDWSDLAAAAAMLHDCLVVWHSYLLLQIFLNLRCIHTTLVIKLGHFFFGVFSLVKCLIVIINFLTSFVRVKFSVPLHNSANRFRKDKWLG